MKKKVNSYNMPVIDIIGDYAGPPPLDLNFKPAQFEEMPVTEEAPEPREYQQKDNSNQYLGDLAASAGPGLLALLGGASASVVSPLFDKGNAYAMKRGAQEEVTKANTSVIDNNGEPLNVRTRDALGEKPYYQSRLSTMKENGSSLLVNGIPAKMYNPLTGERSLIQGYKDGTAYRFGTKDQVTDIGTWQPDMGVGGATATDPYGRKTQEQFDKNKPTKKQTVRDTPGYGNLLGAPLKTIDKVDRITDKYSKDTDILETKKNELNNAVNIFRNPKSGPTELTAAREALIRSITTEPRLTDSDVERALGNDFRPLLAQLGSQLSNKAFGEMSDKQKQDFLAGASTLIRRFDNALNFAYDKSKQRANALPGGKSLFESQTPKRTKSARESEADLISVERAAAKRYGKNTPNYNKFMEFKKAKMGM